MSQPVAWIAKVKMEESKFKKLLKTKPIDQLVVAIEETLFNNHPEYYIFRYIKKEAAVFVCFFFNHGNEHSLKETMEWLSMEAFSLYGDKTEESFVFSTIDAANFNKEDICTAYCLKNTGFEEISEIPDVVWEQFQKDMYSYFFKEVEKDFANNFYKGRIVDKSIVKRCKALSEQRRIKNVLSNLDKASFEHPLYIFDRYYFNGTYVYHQFGQCSILKEIDPYTFVQRPFGASDSAQVVIEGKAVKTDPIHFKKLQKDLKPLHLKDSFAVLKKGFEADMYKQASLELLEKINALDPEQWGTKEFATNFVYQFYFYDVPQLERLEREDEVYFQKYKNLLQRFFDVYFLQDELGYSNENVYKTYKDYESVHPCAHYLMLKNVFRNAHQYGGHVDLLRFSNVTEGIKRLKRSLDNSYYKERNERAIEKLKDDGFFNYVLQMG